MSTITDSKERMILAAMDLFQLQGVNATSVDQILAKSGTGKGQFTHYFKNKEGLIHATLQHLDAVIRSGNAPTGYKIDSWEEMESWFQQYIDFQKSVNFERSCPLGTIANEISNEQELLRQDIRIFLEWSRAQLARFFAERKAASELVKSAEPEALADMCLSIMQGGMLLTKISRDPKTFENAAAQALAYIKSLKRTGNLFDKKSIFEGKA